ncbi:hypothetical protein Dsin_029106 [Dipteronia sinensis]|uniref:Reverse transcriptase domain-containing protein n=1 Tax=Dipteronia sinensis TaxID=43782 RepID=A0AAD9ZSG9_9ROSI|nr:hypothetical protein Dsin_029106 [Dipteronia sinensis]
MEPPPFGSLKDDKVISTCNTENEPSWCPTNLPNHDQCQDLSMERDVDTSNKFTALVEEGDNRNDQCNDQSNDQCNDVDPPSMASPYQCNDQFETRVRINKKTPVTNSVFKYWDMIDNYNSHSLGRIWVGWDPRILNITKISETDQIIHCNAYILDTNDQFRISFVYGSNEDRLRKALWQKFGKKELISCYTKTLKAKEDLLRQKSRIQWLKAGDRNSSYFFKAINGKRNRSKIHTITGDDGSLIEGDNLVKKEAIRHFQTILGYTRPVSHEIGSALSNIIDEVISNGQADFMGKDVTYDEIWEVCFSLYPNKAPCPDGFNAHFFKITWDIVGEDVISAVQEFFRSGPLLKEINATILALIPKVPNPSKMKDFRPISCCNTLYKIIAKIIANRIMPCLPDIYSLSQSAFVAGRCNGDNILLVQELMRNYHKDASCPRLALKVDLMKAFDMVDWGFLLETLTALHFPPKVIMWNKACLTTLKFSISINGELAGFFSGKRGISQGDPMSPYLFVIAMEVLSKIMAKRIEDSPSFKFHWRCDKIKLSHLCIPDDLIMLCNGSLSSAPIVKAALDEFSLLSGLQANHAKSNIFTSGVSYTINQQLINLFGYTVGSLPIRYLGIPIISSRLRLRNCSPLVDRVLRRLAFWLNLGLSYAGRLQLIVSVLTSLQKVGGLGIKDLSSWNKALMIRHIWILSYGTNNLWLSWIKACHLGSKPTTLRTLIFGRLKLHVLALGIGENSSIFGLLFATLFSTTLVTVLAPPYGLTIGIRMVLFFQNGAPRVVYDSGLPIHATNPSSDCSLV